MDKPHSLLDSILGAFVPVHPDGFKFVAAAGLVTLILFALAPPLGWLGAVATAYCAYFFRDPPRVTPARAGLIVSGADGKITAAGAAVPQRELQLGGDPLTRVSVPQRELQLGGDPLTRVSVFLSVFDVHIVRAPISGRIVTSAYTPGAFLNAELDKASEENERHALVIEGPSGERVGIVLIAGLIARRIVTFVGEGGSVARGERIGLIRFGSRVDVYLPKGAELCVEAGQTAIGGETVLAEVEPANEARASRSVLDSTAPEA